jgi:uncharacterized protein YbaR (Trm112 family)
MRKLIEIGTCPKCQGELTVYKTKNYKRFVKCEFCGISYALPKRGSLNNSALECPRNGFPILIVDRKNHPAYFWSDHPCFQCTKYDTCVPIKDLLLEFKELKVYGY